MTTPPPLPKQKSSDWFGRNWPWLIPVTCIVGLGAIAAFIFAVLGAMKASDAYQGAMARAKAAPAVQAALGNPIVDGLLFTGHIESSRTAGKADFKIPIRGSNARATLYAEATKTNGAWHFEVLLVQLDQTGQRIDLSEKALPATKVSPLQSKAKPTSDGR